MARQDEDDWKKMYAAALREQDPKKQLELCEHARRQIQEKQVELAAQGPAQTLGIGEQGSSIEERLDCAHWRP
jgi:hypothetical protein